MRVCIEVGCVVKPAVGQMRRTSIQTTGHTMLAQVAHGMQARDDTILCTVSMGGAGRERKTLSTDLPWRLWRAYTPSGSDLIFPMSPGTELRF